MTVCGTGGYIGPDPGDPDNNVILTAAPAFGGIDLSWTWPAINPHAVAHFQLYRAGSSDVNTAVHIANVGSNFYYDRTDSTTQYFYWLRVVSANTGIPGAWIGPASATGKQIIADVIEDLTNQIDSSKLSSALQTDIGKITQTYNELLDEIQARLGGDNALGLAMADLQNNVDSALTLIDTEVTNRINGDEALIEQVDIIAAANSANAAAIQSVQTAYVNADTALASRLTTLEAVNTAGLAAAIQNEETARVSADNALASSITTTQTTLNDNIASAQTTLQTNIDTVDGKVTDIGALYTAKVTVNGLVGGFGIYNDGSQVDAGFDVDTFWVGRTSGDKRKPFIISGGVTYIDEAAIQKLTFDKLRSSTGGVVVENDLLKADSIDTRGLTIKDASGNIIFSSGQSLDWNRVGGTNRPQDGATRNVFVGNWATATAYAVGDVVLDAGYGWTCLSAHTSNGTNKPPTYPTLSNATWGIYTVKGDSGVNGTRTAVLDMYRNSVAAPTTYPSGSSEYTWASNSFVAPGTANGWTLTPPSPVAGQTLWMIRQVYADTGTSLTSTVTWSADGSAVRAIASSGNDGAPGRRTAYLEMYQWAAAAPTAFPSGNSTYTWATGGFGAPTTANGWSVLPGAAVLGQTLWGCSVGYSDTGTSAQSSVDWTGTNTAYAVGAAGSDGAPGLSGLTLLVSNPSHPVPTDAAGGSPSYVGSGTRIDLFEGATALTYDGTGTANGTWKVVATGTNITAGTPTDSGSYVTVGDHSAITSDNASVSYAITGKRQDGTAISLTASQTVYKQKAGANAPLLKLNASGFAFVAAEPTATTVAGPNLSFDAMLQNASGTVTFVATAYNAANTSLGTITLGGTGNTNRTLSAAQFTNAGDINAAGGVWATRYVKVVATLGTLTDTTTVYRADSGSDALESRLTNDAHTVPSDVNGVVSSYAGAAGTMEVYKGLTLLSNATTPSVTFSLAGYTGFSTTYPAAQSGITVTASTGGYSVSNNLTSDTGTVTIRATLSTGQTLDKIFTVTKSKQGTVGNTGPAGPSVVVTADRPTAYTSTDGVLDGSQPDTVFTATAYGITSPTYSWSFSGLQTNPTASTTASQTITAAQFGTSKRAQVTCTVNGTYKDDATITRIEVSTAAAGATRNNTTVSASAPSSPANGDIWIDNSVFPNLTKIYSGGTWQASVPSYNWDFESGTTSGWTNIVSVANDTTASYTVRGQVQTNGSLVRPAAFQVDPARTYRVRLRVQRASGSTGSITAGVVCLNGSGVEITGSGGMTRPTCLANAQSLPDTSWVTFEGMIGGTQPTSGTDRFMMFTGTVAIAPYFITTSISDVMYVDFAEVDDVTPAAAAALSLKPGASSAAVALGPGYVRKASRTTAYDALVYSVDAYTGGIGVEWQITSLVGGLTGGISNVAPGSLTNAESQISFGIRMDASTGALTRINGASTSAFGQSAVVGDLLSVIFNGSTVSYRKNGVEMSAQTGQTLAGALRLLLALNGIDAQATGLYAVPLTALPSNVAALTGSEAIQNSGITVNGTGQLVGIGTANVVVDNSKVTAAGISAVATDLTNAPAGILNSNVTATSIGAVRTDASNAPTSILNSNITVNTSGQLTGIGTANVVVDNSKVTPAGINAVATDLTNAPAGILNSNVTATGIGAVRTDLTNAPTGILNSNITVNASGQLTGIGTVNPVVANSQIALTVNAGGTISVTGGPTVSGGVTAVGLEALKTDWTGLQALATQTQFNTLMTNVKVQSAQINNLAANKILAGALAASQYIESTNYSPGSTGWRINASGSAEFGEATVRGTITASAVVANSITTASLNDSAVTTAKIGANAVSVSASGTGGAAVAGSSPWVACLNVGLNGCIANNLSTVIWAAQLSQVTGSTLPTMTTQLRLRLNGTNVDFTGSTTLNTISIVRKGVSEFAIDGVTPLGTYAFVEQTVILPFYKHEPTNLVNRSYWIDVLNGGVNWSSIYAGEWKR